MQSLVFLLKYHFLLLCKEYGVCLGVWCLFDGNWIPEAVSQRRPLTCLPLLKAATYTPFTHIHLHTHIQTHTLFVCVGCMLMKSCTTLIKCGQLQDHTCAWYLSKEREWQRTRAHMTAKPWPGPTDYNIISTTSLGNRWCYPTLCRATVHT